MSVSRDNPTQAASASDVELFDFYVAQLEAYLDGELNSEEAIAVRSRLMQEEAYAAALGRLHAQRVQRLEVFKHIEREETNQAAVVRLTDSARKLTLHDRAGSRSWPTWTKVVFGMAACLLVGFGAGWIGVYDLGESPSQARPTPFPTNRPEASGQWIYYDKNGVAQTALPGTGELFEPGMPEDKTTQTPPR